MKKNPNSKGGLFIDWLLKALNQQWFKGLKWENKQKGIFSISWTHKASEQWTIEEMEPFIAWAEFKGKRNGKNDKQLKATFRCALNSKKAELKEYSREKSRRLWQFKDLELIENGNTTKKTRKVNSGHPADIPLETCDVKTEPSYIHAVASLRISPNNQDEILSSVKLPNFESFCSFAHLTPPHQANEISFNFPEAELPKQKSSMTENYCIKSELLDSVTSDAVSNVFTKNTASHRNKNKVIRASCTPSPDRSQLTPPLKDFPSPSHLHSFHQPNTDVWQPNCWTTSLAHQNNFSGFNPFPNDFEELYKSTDHETNNKMDIEMDQFVPVMDISENVRIVDRQAQYTIKPELEVSPPEPMKQEVGNPLREDAEWEKFMQVLERLTPPSDTGLYSYNS